jgi:hypothetical protein
MHGGGPFYSHALRGGNAGLCKERERDVMARHSGRASILARAARHNSDVAVAAALRGGDAEGVCPYAIGGEVSWKTDESMQRRDTHRRASAWCLRGTG